MNAEEGLTSRVETSSPSGTDLDESRGAVNCVSEVLLARYGFRRRGPSILQGRPGRAEPSMAASWMTANFQGGGSWRGAWTAASITC